MTSQSTPTPDSDLVEKVARAICQAEYLIWSLKPTPEEVQRDNDQNWLQYEPAARAAITTIASRQDGGDLHSVGYAPGHYTCICYNCEQQFTGDKRAVRCLACATKALARRAESAPDTSQLCERLRGLLEKFRPLVFSQRLSTEGEMSDCVLRSPAAEMRLRADAVEKRDADIMAGRAAYKEIRALLDALEAPKVSGEVE